MKRALLPLALLLASCDGSASEIVLVVDTDIPNVDSFRVVAVRDADSATSTADLSTQRPPRTIVYVHRGGSLGPLRLTVQALQGATVLVSVEREIHFVPGRSLRLDVFLAAACSSATCPAPLTCGNDGVCRPRVVDPCEAEGTCAPSDAGMIDSPPACTLGGAICGVEPLHLPGDRVVPIPCEPTGQTTITTITGPSGLLTDAAGVFSLQESGPHAVRITLASDSTCAVERAIDVAGTVTIPDSTSVSHEALRDFAARVGTAFIAGRRGAYAIDAAGWYDLRGGATGARVAPEDLRAVAVHSGQPIFGPLGDDGYIYRVVADAPFATPMHEAIVLPEGSREVRALAASISGGEPLLAATKDGAVLVTGLATAPSARAVLPTWDPASSGWAAIASVQAATYGSIWMGRVDSLINVADGIGGELNSGSSVSLPIWIQPAYDAAFDDRDPSAPRLWICGAGGVALWVIADDWSTRSTLPAPTHTWMGNCRDLAIDADGDAWIAGGTLGLVRLDRDATPVVVYGGPLGLPAASSVDRVAAAWDGSSREVWMLDTTARAVLTLHAGL